MSFYINRTAPNGYMETVDEYGTREDAEHDIEEYRMADEYGKYKISTRPCGNWLA